MSRRNIKKDINKVRCVKNRNCSRKNNKKNTTLNNQRKKRRNIALLNTKRNIAKKDALKKQRLFDKNNKLIRGIRLQKNKKRLIYLNSKTLFKKEISSKESVFLVVKEVVLNKIKEIMKIKKVRRVSKTLFITLVTLFTLNIIDTTSRKVVLAINGQEIEWDMDKGLDDSNYEFEIFRGKEKITTTRGSKFLESISLDKDSPEKISSLKMDESDDKVMFTWNASEDRGTNYKYRIVAKNKSFGKDYSSKKTSIEIKSGVEKYIIKLDGKEYQTIIPQFDIEKASLKAGSHTLEIYAVDLAGNVSETKKITFEIDNTKFYIDKYKLATNNKEITNKTHDLYIVKEIRTIKNGKEIVKKEKSPISIGDNIAQYFINTEKPKIDNPKYIYKDDLINVYWEKNDFSKNEIEFYIECKSKNGFQRYKSEKMKYDNGEFLPGYYYKVTTSPYYTVKSTDSFTMDNMVSLDYNRYDKRKLYYFHVAAMNEYGNMSKTKTLEFDFENFTSTREKKDAVRSLLYRGRDVDSDSYRRVTDDVYNTFTYKTIKKMKEKELKIVLTSSDIKNYISENHNAVVTNKNAQYLREDSVIVYNTNSPLEYLVKEIVRVFDEHPRSFWSKNSDFLNAYNQEKNKLTKQELNQQDFLVEAMWMYIDDSDELEYKAPKTYNFIKRFYKLIMLS